MGDAKYAQRRGLSVHTADFWRQDVMKEAEAVVFVVDDDAPTRESLNNLIRSVGLKANLFASAQEFLRSQPANVPSCLVLDVRMP